MYTAKHKLHTARNDTIGLFGFLLSRIIVVIFYDQHTNKRKQRIKVERHEEKSLSILPSTRWTKSCLDIFSRLIVI